MCRKDLPCREELGLLILRTATMIRRKADSNVYMSKVHKITGSNGWILGYLADHENEEIYQKDIEEEFQVRKPTVTGMLQLLEKKGYIYRENSPQDGRLKRIVPTKKAEDIRQAILINIKECEARMVRGIAPEDVELCKQVLWQMYENRREMNRQREQK